MSETPSAGLEIRQGSGADWSALRDLLIVVAVLVVVKQSVLPYSLVYAGPASTFSAISVGTYLLFRRGMTWNDLGLKWPESWLKTAGLTIFVLFVILAVAASTRTILINFLPDIGTSGRFDHVEGNPAAYAIMMVLVWTHGSFFEELLFRAFVISRASSFLGGGLRNDLVAVLISSLFFGYRHYYYQGLLGEIVTGLIGLALGLLYIWFGRTNLLPSIFAHGIINSILQTTRFLGVKD